MHVYPALELPMAFDTLSDDSVDTLIAERLPTWLKGATPEQLPAVHQALVAQQRAQHAVQTLLAQIQPLDQFAAPLLSEALETLLQQPLDVRGSVLRRQVLIRSPSGVGWVPDGIVPRIFTQSLLACALHNFEREETAKAAWRDSSVLLDAQGNAIALQPRAFAGVCRTLDLGGRYQQHLKTVLMEDDARRRASEAVLETGWRTGLEAALWVARLKGDIDESVHTEVQQALADSTPSPITAMDIRVLGHRLQGVVVFQRHRASGTTDPGLIAWIPDDPLGPLSTHASWDALFMTLGQRLREVGYQRFFQRFVSEQDRVPFARTLARVIEGAAAQDALPLDVRSEPVTGALCAHLRRVQVDTLLADAQVLAVPTSVVDCAERDRRLRWLKGLGLDLLGLASFYVPQLGLPLLAIAAAQLVDEVFEGYRDWELGDREAALGHVLGVALNVTGLALGAGVEAAVGGFARSRLVDDLAPTRASDGQWRLIDPRLPGYAVSEHPLAHGQRSLVEGVGHVGIEGQTYKLQGGVEAGVLVHPQRPEAALIRLEDNADGGLRHALEPVAHWSGSGRLLRRLGAGFSQVSDETADALLRSLGMSAAQVRRLHLENAPAPARLYDAAQRYRLHQWYPKLRDEGFEAHVRQTQATAPRAAQPLQRDFPTLSSRAASAILAEATGEQVDILLEQGRVPLALAEMARGNLRDSRLDRACAGFEQGAAVNADTERLALGLIGQWSNWPSGVRVEVRETHAAGLLRAQTSQGPVVQTRQLWRGREGYLAVGQGGIPVPGAQASDDLFQALLWLMDTQQRSSLGLADESGAELANALADRACADRDQAAALIGLQPVGPGMRAPWRLGDGRLGYPLSGRPHHSRGALIRGYQQIFPTLSDVQVEAYLDGVRQRGERPWQHLRGLSEQLDQLTEHLAAWRREAAQPALVERRRLAARRIRHCWRRKRADADGEYRLVIDSERLDSLPVLAAGISFEHVSALTLRRLHLSSVPADFLPRFVNLRRLDLGHNLLMCIPEGIESLTQLTWLNLVSNHIVLDEPGMARLSRLTRLRELDMAHNPLTRVPPIACMPDLRRLSLRDTGLTELPVQAYMHWSLEDIDLRDNRLDELSPTLMHSRRRLAHLSLHDNPLPEATQSAARAALSPEAHGVLPTRRHGAGGQESLERWLDGSTDAEREVRTEHWSALAQASGSGDLMRFLEDLGRSQDYDFQGMDLRRRVWQMIAVCAEDAEVREAVFQQAAGPRTCSDQMLLILSLLEVRVLVTVRTAGLDVAGQAGALVQLGRELYRLDEVDRVASEHIASARARDPYGFHDEVETYLAYRAGLVGPLGLPAQSRYMHHRLFSGVSDTHLRQAMQTILTTESEARIADSLSDRPFWQAFLHESEPQLFDALNAPYHERLEILMEQAGESPEQTTLAAIDALAEARAQGERSMILAQTLRLLRLHPWKTVTSSTNG
ncbi:NEL-type E3 ubiquitin ligase domain-containing protein [Pseudomonas parafulva]|nr:NEL-type E3 ubiquitin ligase domain-containing protein [Pseudomonas parafulva]